MNLQYFMKVVTVIMYLLDAYRRYVTRKYVVKSIWGGL
jgi:hypothetical protein